MKKSGFSLVELVLSIVIIAIALMTVPLMLGQTSKSNKYAMMQESIFAARTKMENILSFKWDDNLTDAGGIIYRVIDVQSGDGDLNRTVGSGDRRRRGHVVKDRRRRMLIVERNATAIGQEVAGEFDDIDDFDGNISTVSPTGLSGATGVKGQYDYLDESVQLSTTVRYINDDANYSAKTVTFDFNTSTAQATTAVNTSSNIKMITIETNSTSHDVPFVFRTFSSNIGQGKYYEKVRP